MTGMIKFFRAAGFFGTVFPLWILLTVTLVSGGCSGQQRRQPPLRQEEPRYGSLVSWELLNYRDRDRGGLIPAWASLYLNGNFAAIEKLPEYRDLYVFIGENSGTNFNALKQWEGAFSPDLDFARLAAARIEKRFLDAAVTYPDDEYGSYFEALIREASDAVWEGAQRKDDFWVYRSYPAEDEFSEIGQIYDFLILVCIEKNLLDEQIKTVMQNVKPEAPLSRDQRNAVSRVQEHFFEGF